MQLVVHSLTGIPGPVDVSWVDAVLPALGDPLAVAAGHAFSLRRDTPGAGGVLVAVVDGEDAARAAARPLAGGSVRSDGGSVYALDRAFVSDTAGPARAVQVVRFDGPRAADLVAAERRASRERLFPLTGTLPGLAAVLYGVRDADGSAITVVLGESVEALHAGMLRILAAPLLPGEDPALLTGPDRVDLLRLVHADVPASVGTTGVPA